MEPPARESVKRIDPQLWALGSSFLCSKVDTGSEPPINSIFSWRDDNSTFNLLPRDEPLFTALNEGDATIDRIQECATGGSI